MEFIVLDNKLHSASPLGASLDAQVPRLLRPVLVHEEFTAAATVFLSELATLFSCDRASIGFLTGRSIRVAAVSQHYQRIDRSVLPEVAAAMEEAALQGISLVFPQPASAFPHITVAHTELARRNGMSRILTVPLMNDERLIGAITLEGRHSNAFDASDVALVEKLAADVAPALEYKWRLQKPLWSRAFGYLRDGLFGLRNKPSQRFRLIAMLTFLVAVLGLVAVPIPNHVGGEARLEALKQRVISAPIDGYLKEAHVRPGDRVKAGDVLAELNDDTLRSQRRQFQAEVAQNENSLAEAMVKGDRTQAALSRAKLDEINAQLELLDQQLTYTKLSAPFDGVVIKGDLQQLLGAPLKRSDALLTLSEGPEFRVIIEVDERDISDVRIDQHGTLVLAAFPDERFPIRVVRMTPLASASNGANIFEVEAVIESDVAKLMPGLKGTAKIGTNTRPAAWKWIARAWHSLTYIVWSKLG